MSTLKFKAILFSVACLVIISSNCFAQQGHVTINQDKNIPNLLALKKELNKDENASDRYKIQIYNGNRTGAESAQKEYYTLYNQWRSSLEFELPRNYKIWVGSFRTRLEADRALKRIKRNFPNAFVFKPKKKKS
ncbi:SPOR domain-containing protein [Sabulilitoribacter arenilitoris]|uniref:SPOR domain-containing protein n=1 Tax=Wocania arenilitoris TaxID=2044858 RepID=A0AAE3EM75_9FLAO|nr:SPOR domain-containing protein [Wocania arenilitoris]MCF7567468.1 SPOR domain-containing protein [Wocania arenilitoris]